MPRFRSLDPEFWTQPQLAPLQSFAKLLLIGLMSQADDHGRFPANPMYLQGVLFPFGKRPKLEAISEALGEIANAREIWLYRGDDGRDYGVLLGWKNAISWQYQVIQRPSAPRYPPPSGGFPDGVIVLAPRRQAEAPAVAPEAKQPRKKRPLARLAQ